MIRKLLLFLLVSGWSQVGIAQQRQLDKAKADYESLAFIDAQQLYLELVEEGYGTPEIYAQLGDTFYFNNDLQSAHTWYAKLFKVSDYTIPPQYYFRYAQTLRSMQLYPEAQLILQKLTALTGGLWLSENQEASRSYLERIDFQSGRYRIYHSKAINSVNSDLGPAFYPSENKVVFASAKRSGSFIQRRHSWNDQAFLDLYAADANASNGKLRNPQPLETVINSKFHESTPSFSADGMVMYFTRNNYVSGNLKTDSTGVNRLKIMRSVKVDGKWSAPTELAFNSDEYSTAHPALSPDGKYLYFASNMPGTKGLEFEDKFPRSDIWRVQIYEDGSCSTPENMLVINTAGRESFPFISSNNTLYFASSGLQGLGGLDVFASRINEDGSINPPTNLGRPINTPYDDFGYIINDQKQWGYFSSNRPGGAGNDDIYRFLQLEHLREPCQNVVKGVVRDQLTGATLSEVKVVLRDADNQIITHTMTASDGSYTFNLECDHQYAIRAIKPEYTVDEKLLSTPTTSGFSRIDLEIKTNKIPVADCDDVAQLLDIKRIYFDFDEAYITQKGAYELAKIKAFLKLYPNTAIDIRSHTDSRGKDAYNLQLSERRAQSTRQWLIDQGILASRITAKGYGESELLNQCSNGVNCSEALHQVNRRSEFIVTGIDLNSDCK